MCNKCFEDKEINDKHYYRNKQGGFKLNLCKSCSRAKCREYNKLKKPRKKQIRGDRREYFKNRRLMLNGFSVEKLGDIEEY